MKKNTGILLAVALSLIGVLLSFAFQDLNRLRPAASLPSDEKGGLSNVPCRIICSAPNIVECVYALGEEKRIVGVSDFVDYPTEALQIERIGGFIDPDFEKMLSLRPDLIILQGRMQKHEEFCVDKKIPYLRADMDSMNTIFDGIRAIGAVLGCEKKADQLVREKMKTLNEIRRKSSRIQTKPTVFLCLGRRAHSLTGVFTVHPSSFVNELLEIAGGENIFNDVQGRYPQISKESLLKRNPDVIIEFHPGEDMPPDSFPSLISDWNIMPTLAAVASKRIYIVTNDYLLVPGPRITQTAQTLFDILHDDAYDSSS
ncbi:MAG: ABC transporter substrate-binding protein [Candidatus Omnitrophica bacterium]|nr:ABC transporter substrate-binding protein [Candidatus Omnitrophota bacterium]